MIQTDWRCPWCWTTSFHSLDNPGDDRVPRLRACAKCGSVFDSSLQPIRAITSFRGPTRWLSNFWTAEITIDGIEYPSTEHAYQAHKTFDLEMRARIAKLEKPGQAKRSGAQVDLRPDWGEVRLEVMALITREKYMNHPELRDRLFWTGDMKLIEGNNWNDRFWGVDNVTGLGNNHLGVILMALRQEIFTDRRQELDKNGS